MIEASETTMLDMARNYLSSGYMPIPVPFGSKSPVLSGWQQLRLVDGDLPHHFAVATNIGLLLGESSHGLVDVDIDSSQALAAADAFLPPTGLVHGRPGKPHSHRWYIAEPIPKTEQFKAPDGKCLIELRSTGAQTIVPPSIHPEGERLLWEQTEDPRKIDGTTLRQAVALVATCALLARYWPSKGSRHNAALAAGGVLLRGGLSLELASKIVGTAARAAGDEEWQLRRRDVESTAQNLAAGQPVTGIPSLADILPDGEEVVSKLCNWLSLTTGAAGPMDWGPPLPFTENTGPDFPVDALPQAIRPFVESQAEALQVPLDLVAGLAIGVAAAASAGHCQVQITHGWTEPLNLYVVVVLPSGERKSPAFRVMTAPLEERERALVEDSRPRIEAKRVERDVLEMRLKDAKIKAAKANKEDEKTKMCDVESLVTSLADFENPNMPRLLADDVTTEAVASLLAEQGGRIAVMSSEGGLFETLAGRYNDGVPNIDVYLKGYSGDTLRVDRKGRPPEFVPNPALTLCLTVQPDVIRELSKKKGFRGRGLLARFLYVIPRSLVGYRSNAAPTVPDELRQRWYRALSDIARLPYPIEGDQHSICLSIEAHAAFQSFRDEVEAQLRPGAEFSDMADWGNKLAGCVARLAGILHLLSQSSEKKPWETPISGTTMQGAVRLGKYFAAHAAVAFSMMGTDHRVEKARRLLAVIHHHDLNRFSLRDLHQIVRRSFTVEDLSNTLEVLRTMNYIRPTSVESAGKRGRPQSPSFDVNPLARTQNTQNTPKSPSAPIFEDFEDSVYTCGGLEVDEKDNEQDIGEV